MIAGMLLAARALEAAHELPFSSVNRILDATKASRTRAYEIKHEIEARLLELERPPGRPRAEPAPAPVAAHAALMHEMLCFLMAHPGCLQLGERRARYSDVYRHFVLGLRERHADVAATEFAHALAIPLGTLEDWLRSPPIAEPSIAGPAAPCDASAADHVPDPGREAKHDARQAQIETVLAAWRAWHGSFGAFCAHIRRDHRLELGTTLIANILFEYGLRIPARRDGRSVGGCIRSLTSSARGEQRRDAWAAVAAELVLDHIKAGRRRVARAGGRVAGVDLVKVAHARIAVAAGWRPGRRPWRPGELASRPRPTAALAGEVIGCQRREVRQTCLPLSSPFAQFRGGRTAYRKLPRRCSWDPEVADRRCGSQYRYVSTMLISIGEWP